MSKLSSLRAVQRGVNNKPTIKGKRERDHHPATLILKIDGVTERERDHHPATLILKIEGETERKRERETTTQPPLPEYKRKQGETTIQPPIP